MADAKITALTELTTATGDDLLAIVDDPAGTPATKKITKTNLGADWKEYDYIVAATGGTHTTLGAAITAASAGDSIFVRSGTYSESAINTSTNNLTIVGENRETSIISMGANLAEFYGTNLSVQNLCFSMSTGGVLAGTGANQEFINNRFIKSTGTTNKGFRIYSSYGKVLNNIFDDTTSADGDTIRFGIDGTGTICNDNLFNLRMGNFSGEGPLSFGGTRQIISGNYIYAISGSTAGSYLVTNYTANCNFTGNTLYEAGVVSVLYFSQATYQSISGNVFYGGITSAELNSTQLAFTGNTVRGQATGASHGVYVRGAETVVSSNTIWGAGTTGSAYGIRIHDGSSPPDNVVISGNRVGNWNTGVLVAANTNDYTVITGNNLRSNSTNLTDNGTNTVNSGNATA